MTKSKEVKKLKRAVIKEELVVLTGNVNHAIVLNQMIYWSERIKDSDEFIKEELKRARTFADGSEESLKDIKKTLKSGWIYKKSEEMIEDTMLSISRKTMDRLFDRLVENEWLDRRRNPKYKWDKTWQYRVDLNKVQKDLFKFGYSLEGYTLHNNDDDSARKNDYNTDENDNNSPDYIDQQKGNKSDVPSKGHSDQSKGHSDQSKGHSDHAIPEITPEVTPEITRKDLDLDLNLSSTKMRDYIWDLKLPMGLKKYFNDRIEVLVDDPTFDLTEIEYFYNTHPELIDPNCGTADTWYLNDIEFTKVIKDLHAEGIKRPIVNMSALVKKWVTLKISFKNDNFKDNNF